MFPLALLEHIRDILLRIGDVLNSHDTSEQNVCFRVFVTWRNNTRTIDQEDSLHQSDVLPHLGLARDGCNLAHFLLAQGVDDRRFTCVRVSDETDRDLLAVRMQCRELTQ